VECRHLLEEHRAEAHVIAERTSENC